MLSKYAKLLDLTFPDKAKDSAAAAKSKQNGALRPHTNAPPRSDATPTSKQAPPTANQAKDGGKPHSGELGGAPMERLNSQNHTEMGDLSCECFCTMVYALPMMFSVVLFKTGLVSNVGIDYC